MKSILLLLMISFVYTASCPVFKCDSTWAASGETCSVIADSFLGITIKKCENADE